MWRHIVFYALFCFPRLIFFRILLGLLWFISFELSCVHFIFEDRSLWLEISAYESGIILLEVPVLYLEEALELREELEDLSLGEAKLVHQSLYYLQVIYPGLHPCWKRYWALLILIWPITLRHFLLKPYIRLLTLLLWQLLQYRLLTITEGDILFVQ